jgi:hypothetical protein
MSRLQRRGRDLDELKAQITLEYGPSARIVSAERVVQGGIGGFLAKRFFEVVIETPDAPAATPHLLPVGGGRVGIAALLAEADAADDTIAERSSNHDQGPGGGEVNRTISFDDVLAQIAAGAGFAAQVAPAQEAPPVVSVPLRGAGDLVLVVGLGQEALPIALALAHQGPTADIRAGGAVVLRGDEPLADRRTALAARAAAVRRGRAVFVAFGITPGQDAGDVLRAIGADWVWVVVDASRKPEDTQRWVARIGDRVTIDAVAVVGNELTATPQSVALLGLPVGWSQGAPAVVKR